MSVLIKGMEMPKSCLECRLFNDPWCMAKNGNQWRTAYNRPPRGEKQNDCPLIEVQPHGRLIDADIMIKKYEPDINRRIYGGNFIFDLEHAPTVIPADKDGKT